jgi:iron-sulfur cluster repair protein YtfE (RIC family)
METKMGIRPSDVRTLLRSQHEQLRMILFEAERLASLVQKGHLEHVVPMNAACELLGTSLGVHIEVEELLALPHLRQADAWGVVRVQRLQEEHEAQRAAVATLVKLAHQPDAAELARALRALATTLLEDMRREDQQMLTDEVLRDDVVSIAQTDG